MRFILASFLLCMVPLLTFPSSTSAQGRNPGSGNAEDSFHYFPPSARQSVEIGNFYFHRKDYRGALSRYKEAIKDDPYYAPAYLSLGRVYEQMGKKREALTAYRKYLNTLPSEKQANEATGAHKAIHRLERQIRKEHQHSHAAPAPSSTTGK